jgi:soluble lytic murein transglycosylase-like protein
MQLMPQTASVLGVRDPFDARENILAGVRHLRGLMDRFGQDLPLALAAYNAGERAVTMYGGIPPYPETQQYVRKILADVGGGDGTVRRAVFFKLVGADGSVTFTNVAPASRRR